MRPVTIRMSALGNSPWIPINYLQNAFNLAVGVYPSAAASLTYSVQFALETFQDNRRQLNQAGSAISIARVTTTATVTEALHGLSTGDSIEVIGAGTPFDTATAEITVIDANSYSYVVANSGLTASLPGFYLGSMKVFTDTLLAAQTTRQNGQGFFGARAIRLNVSVYASGTVDLIALQGLGT